MVECGLFIDDFTGDKSVIVSKVMTEDIYPGWFAFISSDGYSTIEMTFTATELFMYIKFATTSPYIRMVKGDEIIMLFEDKTTLNFTFKNAGNNGCNVHLISIENLNTLATKKLIKMRVTTKKSQEVYFLYGPESADTFIRSYLVYKSEYEGQALLKDMAKQFAITTLRELPEALQNGNLV